MSKRDDELLEAAKLYAWRQYKNAELEGRDISTFLAGCRCAEERIMKAWRNLLLTATPNAPCLYWQTLALTTSCASTRQT